MSSRSHIEKICVAVLCCAAIFYSETAWSGTISCESGFGATIKPKGNGNPLAVQDTLTECMRLFGWKTLKPQTSQEAQQQYDSLRLYVETCASSDSESWQVFVTLDGAVQLMSDDTTRYDAYRAWLVSVLYLNTTVPQYFCECMGSIAGTYQYGKYHPVGYLAVLNYLRTHHRECWGSADSAEYAKDSAYDTKHGYDASHLPSLDSMGLGFLLHQNTVVPSTPLPQTYLASFTSNPNPFKDETTLSFVLNRMTYTTVEVFDVLGRKVWGDDHGYSLDAGLHTVHIDASSLPSGSLYARISTGFGEVQTVKLVHEQ